LAGVAALAHRSAAAADAADRMAFFVFFSFNSRRRRRHMLYRQSRRFGSPTSLFAVLAPIVAAIAMGIAGALAAPASKPPAAFNSPREAARALLLAAKTGNGESIVQILGADTRQWLSSGDPTQDAQERQRFVGAYEQKSAFEMQGPDKAVLTVGNDNFPFPFPLVRKGNRWSFDAAAGKEELLNRRVGRNELHTVEALRAIVAAQREYAGMERAHGQVPEYAQKFRSSPGKKDGLYWPAAAGEAQSPLGPLVANAVRDGYRPASENSGPIPFQGYHFRILTGQGEHAPGGTYDYVVKGKMIGGFAVIAYPATYGVSGVKTFMINHDGTLYEADLGPQTLQAAEKIQTFDPGNGWRKE